MAVASGLGVLGLLGPGSTGQARAAVKINTNSSGNWAGYSVSPLNGGPVAPVTAVSATWIVPSVSQRVSGQAEYSSTWVGIGGGCIDAGCLVGDQTLIQAGTDQLISAAGTPTYSAWFEIIPAPSITDAGMTVHPGDSMTVTINQGRIPETWDITIKNNTTGQNDLVASDQQVPLPYPSDYTTADYVFESPLVPAQGGYASLPKVDSGPVTFDLSTLNGFSTHFKSSEALQMVDISGQVQATPSSPDPDGDGFNVCANEATSCTAPSSG